MLALYRAGRQAEALDAYERTRLGSPRSSAWNRHRLSTLQAQILNQDPSLTPTERVPVKKADTEASVSLRVNSLVPRGPHVKREPRP